MPKNQKTYRVFISSPRDVAEQRAVARAAVESVSSFYERRGLRVESWLWEKDAVSEFGASAQDIIANQLGEYDIYIGLMGARFGSPTGKHGSGTEEEFREALEAHKARRILRLGFFFKNVQLSTANLSTSDIAQLQKVGEFKEAIGPLGLYQEFKEDHELSRFVQRLVTDAIEGHAESGTIASLQYNLHTKSEAREKPVISRLFFNESLNRLEEDLTNGTRLRLTLEDVWIDPDLRLIGPDAMDETVHRSQCSFTNVVKWLAEGSSVVVFGDEKAGRSSLCRTAFTRLYSLEYFPIIMPIERLNVPDNSKFLQRVRLAFAEQYENVSSADASRIPTNKIIVIIDDFDRAKINSRCSSKLLQHMLDNFCSVLLSTSPLFALNVVGSTAEIAALSKFRRAEIKAVGHRKRYDLIERWCLAGQNEQPSEEHLRNEVERRRSVIDRILATSLVPRTPITVLVLLQAMEARQIGDLARTGYVRYYKFLIDSLLLRNTAPDVAELSYALLPEVAWAMYEDQTDTLQPDKVERVVESFADRRALRKTALYSALSALRRVGMFEDVDDGYRFRHRYTYYFFVADYISKQLAEPAMIERVKQLCRQISLKESSSILIFLSFHSNSHLVTNELLVVLRSVFEDGNRFELTGVRTAAVNQLIYDTPRRIIDHERFRHNRERRLELADVASSLEGEQNDEVEDQASSDKTASEMTTTFIVVEVLGHILRNHYAQLEAEPKKEIFSETIDATLRCLGAVFDRLAGSLDEIVTTVAVVTDKLEQDVSTSRKETLAKRIVFYVVVMLFVYIVNRLVRAVGDESLEITYKQTVSNFKGPTRRYIELAIQLDCFRDFPLENLKQIMLDLGGDRLGIAAVQTVVARRLDMRPTLNRSELQRICDTAGLNLKSRLIARQKQ